MLGLWIRPTHISCVWGLTAALGGRYTTVVIEGGPGASVAGMLWGLIRPLGRALTPLTAARTSNRRLSKRWPNM
jgi:hypothetical protein